MIFGANSNIDVNSLKISFLFSLVPMNKYVSSEGRKFLLLDLLITNRISKIAAVTQSAFAKTHILEIGYLKRKAIAAKAIFALQAAFNTLR